MDWKNAMHSASDYWDENLPEIENLCETGAEIHEPLAIINDDPWLNLDSWSPVPRSPALSELDELSQISKISRANWSCEEDKTSENDQTPQSSIIHLSLIENSEMSTEADSNSLQSKIPASGHKRWKNKSAEPKKNKWTREEDNLIIKLYNTYGGNWKKIAGFLNGKPSVAVKNRYYGTIKRKMSSSKNNSEKKKPALFSSIEPIKYMGKAWNEDELIDSLLAEPGKASIAQPSINTLLESLETVKVSVTPNTPNTETLSAEEKRKKLQDLYAKRAMLEAFVLQTKTQLRNIDDLKNS